MKRLYYHVLLLAAMLPLSVMAQSVTYNHDESVMNQFTIGETGAGSFTPDWYYDVLHKNYRNGAMMTNKQFFRSQMNLTLYQEVPHAEALDSALTERMRVEAKNIADRTPGLTDIAWQVERGKIESKLSVLKGNIERITLEGGSAHSYTTWLERYNAINCGLQAVRDALIFLIFKGSQQPTKIEQYIIERTIIEYYREFFTPFEGFSEEEKKELHQTLVIAAKSNGEYEKYEEELQARNGTGSYDVTDEERAKYERNSRLSEKLQAVVDDAASTEGEKNAARNQLQRLTPEIVEGKFLEKIEREIAKREQQRKSLRVRELSFNSYYEFARQRIPQIIHEDSIQFPINDFAAILKPFYRGGALEYTLNNDMDGSLFDEQFIVFEIDKVKDDPVLFPIIVLIIMDVFTQKMRIKNKVRKCLVIEEAWKAIATPVMAEYIKYLYKTARKHWAMVGVVTQEIQDITSSPIVKEAIINNSDVFMLLDQSKFKDKFDDIKATLALTDIDCKKIFTINRLDNKVGRSPFKEVFIKRGTEGDVFGIEEPRECYMSYTTEKAEKEALKLYRRELNCNHQQAIEAFVRDWERSGIGKSLEFAQLVNKQGKVLNLPPKKQMIHA